MRRKYHQHRAGEPYDHHPLVAMACYRATMLSKRSAAFILLLVASLAIAVIAMELTPIIHYWQFRTPSHLIPNVIAPSTAWLLTVAYGFARYRWHGLWFLLGAPFALFYPYLFAKLAIECWWEADSPLCHSVY